VPSWQESLKFDPIPPLLSSGNEAVGYFTRRDLLDEDSGPVSRLWRLPAAQKILKKQQPDGSWPRPGLHKHEAINDELIEAWKQFRFLVQVYGFTRDDPAARRAAEFLFSCQTEAGDIRGFLANQYATYYTGAILSLLIQAGYEDDPRVEKGLQWLLSMRQDDLGWSVPMITYKLDQATIYRLSSEYAEPLEPDRSKPFSHNATGMVIRAFAAHSRHRQSKAARVAASLLKSRFFQPDAYTSYQAASYWVRFQYPFWWNNLVAALDSVTLIDPSRDEPMDRALAWLVDHQQPDGLWQASYVEGKAEDAARTHETRLWVTLSICRVLRRIRAVQ
jgi:Prenyltransferase and squalene oxidase repeat